MTFREFFSGWDRLDWFILGVFLLAACGFGAISNLVWRIFA